jgi:hypothetical protein
VRFSLNINTPLGGFSRGKLRRETSRAENSFETSPAILLMRERRTAIRIAVE